jgi:hypothetical protein
MGTDDFDSKDPYDHYRRQQQGRKMPDNQVWLWILGAVVVMVLIASNASEDPDNYRPCDTAPIEQGGCAP